MFNVRVDRPCVAYPLELGCRYRYREWVYYCEANGAVNSASILTPTFERIHITERARVGKVELDDIVAVV